MSSITNAVVDISHFQSDVQLDVAKEAGLIGIIHKATQGTGYTDPRFAQRQGEAANAGLLFGAYHFGTGGSGAAQAQYFLSVVNPGPQTLLALDYERNPGGASMTIGDAVDFVQTIYNRVSRWPVFYGGAKIKQDLGGGSNPILANCPFWLAEYGPVAHVPPNWPTWTLWQYTDGAVGPGPYAVPGIGPSDRDKFNGDATTLTSWWGT